MMLGKAVQILCTFFWVSMRAERKMVVVEGERREKETVKKCPQQLVNHTERNLTNKTSITTNRSTDISFHMNV